LTRPRQILEGTTYAVSRRCSERRFFLKPSYIVNQIFLYCLACAAKKYDILIHAFEVMANHYHLVLTDTKGNLPLFMQWLDSNIARALNAHYGRWEHFWDPGSYDPLILETPETVANKIVYGLANPVAAGLVKRSRQWSGVSSVGLGFGATMDIRRPEHFFRENGPLPDEVTLTLSPPPELAHLGHPELDALIAKKLFEEEDRLREELRSAGLTFAGKNAMRKLRHSDSPRTRAPRRQLNPRVACSDPERRVLILARLKTFEAEYRECYRQWRQGARDVIFPSGTYQLRVVHGAACRAPP